MASDEWDKAWDGNDVTVAATNFPGRGQEIERLAVRDEEFKVLCQDFAVVLAIHQRWQDTVAPEQTLRLHEYGVLMTELRAEIERALRNADVISFPKPRRP